MDPISRESSPSYLPVAGLIAGVLGLLLGVVALVNASKASSRAAAYTDEKVAAQAARLDGIEASASSASANADRAVNSIVSLQRSTNEAFTTVAGELTKVNTELAKVQDAASSRSTKAPAGAASAPAVAGPDEYVVAGGDTGMKIARAKGVSLADLQAVNPGVNWNALKVGQKIKLPKK